MCDDIKQQAAAAIRRMRHGKLRANGEIAFTAAALHNLPHSRKAVDVPAACKHLYERILHFQLVKNLLLRTLGENIQFRH